MSQEDDDPFVTPSSFPARPSDVNESFTVPPSLSQYGFPSTSPPFPNARLEDVGLGSSYPDSARLSAYTRPDTFSSPFDDTPYTYSTVAVDNDSSYSPSLGAAVQATPLAPPSYTSYASQSYEVATPEYGASSTSGNDFIAPSPFEGLSLETSDDAGASSSFSKRRKSVLESLTIPTLERRSVGFTGDSPRRSFVEDGSPVQIERRSFSESPDISRSTSIMEVVSFLPSVPQPTYEYLSATKARLPGRILPLTNEENILEGFPSSPAKRRSIIDGIPAPARTSAPEVMQAQLSTLPDNRKSTLFAFDRFYSIEEEDGRSAQPSAAHGQDRPNINAHKMHKSPMVIGAKRDTHLLTTHQLVAITCFAVAGGPFGFEDTVLAGGAALTLLGLFIFPVFWSAPIALMTAELSCMIPESGGHVLWVYRAFGPFWSFINSFFAFTCSVLDNALYPALFVEYLGALLYGNAHTVSYGWAVVIKIFVVAVAAIVNIAGVDVVGTSAIVLGVGVLAPFAIMCLLGIFQLNFSWTSSENIPATISWGKFITVLLWNTSGDMCSRS